MPAKSDPKKIIATIIAPNIRSANPNHENNATNRHHARGGQTADSLHDLWASEQWGHVDKYRAAADSQCKGLLLFLRREQSLECLSVSKIYGAVVIEVEHAAGAERLDWIAGRPRQATDQVGEIG